MESSLRTSESNLDLFYKRIRPVLFALIYRICGEETETEDIVQNTLMDSFLTLSQSNLQNPDHGSVVKVAFQQMRETLGQKQPWNKNEFGLVSPLHTYTNFWESIKDDTLGSHFQISQKESFHIGFLSLLQNLPFNERVIFIFSRVLGCSIPQMGEILEWSEEEIRERLDYSNWYMETNYFFRNGNKTLWRCEKDSQDLTNKFVNVLNKRDQESFQKAIDPNFRCLLLPAPLIEQQTFFEEFLPKAPKCRLLEVELNGLKAFVFEDDKDVQAIAVIHPSSKGVATLLGYDFESLPLKIRNLINPTY